MVCYSKLFDDIFARLFLSAARYLQEHHEVTPWLVVVFLFPSYRSVSLSYPIQILPENEFKIHFPQVQEQEVSNLFSVSVYTIKTLPRCSLLTMILKGLCMQPVSIHLGSKNKTGNCWWWHSNSSSVCYSHPSFMKESEPPWWKPEREGSALCIESPQLQ